MIVADTILHLSIVLWSHFVCFSLSAISPQLGSTDTYTFHDFRRPILYTWFYAYNFNITDNLVYKIDI